MATMTITIYLIKRLHIEVVIRGIIWKSCMKRKRYDENKRRREEKDS